MELVGQYLKKHRKSKKIDIIKISKELNISEQIIESIENNDFSADIGNVYWIGYIRSYAKLLKLNEKELIDQYKVQIFFREKQNITVPKPIENFEVLNFFLNYKLISVFSIILLSTAFYIMFIDDKDYSLNYAVISDVPENLQSEIEEFEFETVLFDIKEERKTQYIDESKNIELTTSNKISGGLNASIPSKNEDEDFKNKILIKSLDSTWIQMRNNEDEIVLNKLLKKNEEYSYFLGDNYSITTGNAGNLIIFIDGEVKGKLGKKGEVIESIIITPDLF